MLLNNTNSHYIIEKESNIIGFITISVSRDEDIHTKICEIIGFYLDREYIGFGYGKEVMDWIKKKSKVGDMIKFLFGYWKKIIVQEDFMKNLDLFLMTKLNPVVLEIL